MDEALSIPDEKLTFDKQQSYICNSIFVNGIFRNQSHGLVYALACK